MQIVADVVVTNLILGVSQRTGKEYYRFNGVIVGCADFPLLAGTSFDKFISKEVYEELSTLTCDRFDCSIGLSRTAVNSRDCDLGFNLFINGFPKEDEPPVEEPAEVPTGSVSPETVPDKNKDKGGK